MAADRTFLAGAHAIAAEVGYDDQADQSVDFLIEYKNALEDAHFNLCGVLDDLLTQNARGESHYSAADVLGTLFSMRDGTIGAVDDRMTRLREEYREAVQARDLDEQRWSDAETGQDTEEAEESGRLIGRAEALREALHILGAL